MEKEELAILLQGTTVTLEAAKSALEKRFEAVSKVKTPLDCESAERILREIYRDLKPAAQPFGETVDAIMREIGLTKKWGNEVKLDIPRAVKLTKLSKGIFQTNMWKSNCVVDMALVISMAIGFQLSNATTNRLLQSAGLAFRLDNPEHIAYMFLLEYCQGMSVEDCNKILNSLGIRKSRQLGSHPRGKDGEFEGYNKDEE